MELVQIKRTDLEFLVLDHLELRTLNALGVDNWVGYDEVEWPTSTDVAQIVETFIA